MGMGCESPQFQSKTVYAALRVLSLINTLEMHTQKQNTSDKDQATPFLFNEVNNHSIQLQKSIKDFFAVATAADFIEVNNDLLNAFLKVSLESVERYDYQKIQNMVFMATLQNKFLASIKEHWDGCHLLSNLKMLSHD